MALDVTAVDVAAITSVPATVAAVLSYLGNRRTKVTNRLAHENRHTLHGLTNGIMDEKIKRAVRQVMQERPEIVTEAQLAEALESFLSSHLEDYGKKGGA